MSKFDVHVYLLYQLNKGLDARVEVGIDEKRLTQDRLAKLSGVPQPNISAILRGRSASEATWQKLMDVAWPG